MPDSKNRFVTLPPQALIQPLDSETEQADEKARRPDGLYWRVRDKVLSTLVEIVTGLMPYIIVSAVLLIAIGVFFGVSVQAAIILLGLGAVGLGVLFAASQG